MRLIIRESLVQAQVGPQKDQASQTQSDWLSFLEHLTHINDLLAGSPWLKPKWDHKLKLVSFLLIGFLTLGHLTLINDLLAGSPWDKPKWEYSKASSYNIVSACILYPTLFLHFRLLI